MKKTYIMPKAMAINLQGETHLMVASTNDQGGLNNVTYDESKGGGDQLTRQQSFWDNWSE